MSESMTRRKLLERVSFSSGLWEAGRSSTDAHFRDPQALSSWCSPWRESGGGPKLTNRGPQGRRSALLL